MKQDRGWDNFDNTGPYWNFSSPRVTEWFLNEVAAEIVREANVQVSRLDHTLFIHFLYLLITFLFYIYIYTFLWHQNGIKVMKWSSISLQQKSEAVFFDETDYLYCGGTAGNCSADVHTGDARQLLQMIQTGVQTISNIFKPFHTAVVLS